MKKLGLVVYVSIAASLAVAADTKPVKNPAGNCTIAVPSNWMVGTLGDAQSPDKKASLTVSSPKHGLSTMAQVKQLAPTVYTDDKVVKDSGSEFVMEGKSITGKPNVYRAVPAGDMVCLVELIYENGDVAGARAIVDTLKAAK